MPYFVLLVFLLFLGGCSFDANSITPQEKSESTTGSVMTGSGEAKEEIVREKTPEEIKAELIKQKIQRVQGKLELKGLISQGDLYLQSDELALALKNYIAALKKSPTDARIKEKI